LQLRLGFACDTQPVLRISKDSGITVGIHPTGEIYTSSIQTI